MSRFGHLDKRKASQLAASDRPAVQARVADEPAAAEPAARVPAARAKAREGKKPVIGYFSEDLSRELKILSVTENTTMQSLLGEAIDLLMTDRGRNRFNER